MPLLDLNQKTQLFLLNSQVFNMLVLLPSSYGPSKMPLPRSGDYRRRKGEESPDTIEYRSG